MTKPISAIMTVAITMFEITSPKLNQRLTGLYEDIGHVLNRYYEIDEADKGDMDNDGKNEPDDEEYLQNKRDAITKAVKGEAVGEPDNRDLVDKPDSPAKKGRDNENESLDPDNTDLVDQPADPAKDGEEMKEIKRSLREVGGVVGIPSLGRIVSKFSGK